jgi:NADPH-dependent 2,4-dienoyl-CoA reductase/sulfur reductase-like enzyme
MRVPETTFSFSAGQSGMRRGNLRLNTGRGCASLAGLTPKKSTFLMNYDLIVIGGGPAGYVGAIRAAQLGKKVACVENDRAGGTCLNWGCIPTKALLKNAELYHTITHRAEEFGLKIGSVEYDWSKVIGRSRGVSDKLNKGIEFLFKKNKIDYLRGTASIPAAGKVEVTAATPRTSSSPPVRRRATCPASPSTAPPSSAARRP